MTDTILLLSDREKVRERPGMYIGNTSELGLETIVREVIDNAYDEYPNYQDPSQPIEVTLHADNSVTVADYGRGISPYESQANPGQIEERLAFTRLGAGGKMRANRKQNHSQFSAGLNGTGAAATNFASAYFEVTIYKPDGIYHDRYENGGQPVQPLVKGQLPHTPNPTQRTGTVIHFKPDPTFLRVTTISVPALKRYFNQMQYLHAGSTVIFKNERDGETLTYQAKDGLLDYCRQLAKAEKGTDLAFQPVLLTDDRTEDVMGQTITMHLQIALALSKANRGKVLAFTNTTYNTLGGTHEQGFYQGLVELVRHYYKTFQSEVESRNKAQIALIKQAYPETPFEKLVKRPQVEDRFYAIIDLKHDDPELQPQTKDRLVSPEVSPFVKDTVFRLGVVQLDKQIGAVQKLLDEIVKELAEKAKDKIKKVKIDTKEVRLLTSSKLAAAKTHKPEEAEIFLVEGDSAGGSIKSNRDPRFQAVLALRGKVLNVEKATRERALANTEISTFFAALGAGFGETFDIKKVKYHKIIIATDQDVDGLHIRVLLITLIARYAMDLLRHGYVYFLETPLFVNELANHQEVYKYDDESQQAFLAEHRKEIKKVHRNKGLGELEKHQVISTILTPETRRLIPCQLTDDASLHKVIHQLMGNDVSARRGYFMEDD